MEKQILGVHTFYTNDLNQGDYKSIDLMVQLASALYWQRSFGPIGLFTTDAAERQLFQYGIHRLYTFIDVIKYRELPFHPRFWAYNKMQMAYTLAQRFPQICVIDKDFYIKSRKYFNQDAKILYLHDEKVDLTSPTSIYANPDEIYKKAEIKNPIKDWGNTAFNTAMLYLNEPGEILEEWMSHAQQIVINCNKWEPLKVGGDMTFIEQYMLAALCKERGVEAESYLKSTWTHSTGEPNSGKSGWSHTDPQDIAEDKILNETYHTWSLKTHYANPEVRRAILTRVMGDLKIDFPGIELAFEKLFNEAELLLEDNSNLYEELKIEEESTKQKPVKTKTKSIKKPKREKQK